MRKNGRKIHLQRETLRLLNDASQRQVAGGILTRRCTDAEECTQSVCAGCGTTFDPNSCNNTCYTCVFNCTG